MYGNSEQLNERNVMFFIKLAWCGTALGLAVIADHRRTKPFSKKGRHMCLCASGLMLAFYLGTFF